MQAYTFALLNNFRKNIKHQPTQIKLTNQNFLKTKSYEKIILHPRICRSDRFRHFILYR